MNFLWEGLLTQLPRGVDYGHRGRCDHMGGSRSCPPPQVRWDGRMMRLPEAPSGGPLAMWAT